MAPLRSIAAAALLFLSTASSHFVLLSPPSLEGNSLDESQEANAPCGARVPDLSQDTTNTFKVDGDFVALRLGHPQATWLIRGTLMDKAAGNWSQLWPIVTQNGLGNFCEPSVSVPKDWAGKTGVIGIVAKAPDGILYQCAVVNFVAGSNTPGGSCTNGSAVTASFSSDSTLSSMVGESSGSTPPPDGGSSNSEPSGSASNPSGSAASALTSSLGALLLTMAIVMVGNALL